MPMTILLTMLMAAPFEEEPDAAEHFPNASANGTLFEQSADAQDTAHPATGDDAKARVSEIDYSAEPLGRAEIPSTAH